MSRSASDGKQAGTLIPPAFAADAAPAAPEQAIAKPPVYVDWGPCDPLGEIGSILRVELASRLLDGPAAEDAYRTIVTCSGGVKSRPR